MEWEDGEGMAEVFNGLRELAGMLVVAAGVAEVPFVPAALSPRVEASPFRMAVAVEVALIAAAIVLNGRELDALRCQGLEDSLAGGKLSEGR